MIGDGQVSMGGTVFKPNARKVRIIGGGKVICGFAGSTADCFALLDALEKKLDEYPGQLLRAGVELAKMWRTDKFLRHLEALLIAVDKDISITLSGNGDVISEPLDGVIGQSEQQRTPASALGVPPTRILVRCRLLFVSWSFRHWQWRSVRLVRRSCVGGCSRLDSASDRSQVHAHRSRDLCLHKQKLHH